MGQAPSIAEVPTTFGPIGRRTPPSASTYAKLLASQTFSHLPPDSPEQFSHEHHEHVGPAQGVWDCVQKSERVEDRMGHCFTLRGEEELLDLNDISTADGRASNELLRFGTRDHSERLLVGEEPMIFTKGDAFAIMAVLGMLILALGLVLGLRWVLRLGKRMRANARAQQDVEAVAPGTKTEHFIQRRARSASLVRVRRGGFCDVLPLKMKMELIQQKLEVKREKAREAKPAEELVEMFVDGEDKMMMNDEYQDEEDSACSEDEDDTEKSEQWSDVFLANHTTGDWKPTGIYGDLIMLDT